MVGKLNFLLRSPVKLGSSANEHAFLILASDNELRDIWRNGLEIWGLSIVGIDIDEVIILLELESSTFKLSQRLNFLLAGCKIWFPFCEFPRGNVFGLLKLGIGLDKGDVISSLKDLTISTKKGEKINHNSTDILGLKIITYQEMCLTYWVWLLVCFPP